MTIQWYPGHMAKARREVEEKLKLVDLVIELVDARAPKSSQNPLLQELLQKKPKLMILMKQDLADEKATNKWLTFFEKQQEQAIAINVNHRSDVQKVIRLAKNIQLESNQKDRDEGVQTRPVRAMVVGISNVGKSTLINRLAQKRIAQVGNRPGITRHQQWVKVMREFELLDTPGILWPKFEDEQIGLKLAAIGTIKDHLLPLQDIAAYVITYLQTNYPLALEDRYGIQEDETDMWDVFEHIGKQHGALESGGAVNFDQVAHIVLQDLRTGRLGRISFE